MDTFSIVICTYNRSLYLKNCLIGIENSFLVNFPVEVIVVDNNSTDDTKAIVENFIGNLDLKYYCEVRQGLSFARNLGFSVAKGNWIIYLDDDGIPFENFLVRIVEVKGMKNWDAWGGVDVPFYIDSKPIWMKDEYVSERLPFDKIADITNSKYFFSGGIMVIKKSVLKKLGGFNIKTGMRGNLPGYGEETEFQIRMRKFKFSIGYDPELRIKHAIQPYKLDLTWLLKSAYSNGRDRVDVFNINLTNFEIFKQLLISTLQIFFYFFKSFFKLFFSREYYLENWFFDIFKKPVKRFGTILKILNSR